MNQNQLAQKPKTIVSEGQTDPVQVTTDQVDLLQTTAALGDPVQKITANNELTQSETVQNISAQSGATVNSSFLQGNEFYGPVYIGIGADSKHEEVTGKGPATPHEDSVSVSTADCSMCGADKQEGHVLASSSGAWQECCTSASARRDGKPSHLPGTAVEERSRSTQHEPSDHLHGSAEITGGEKEQGINVHGSPQASPR
ncbi:hypothetical protein MHYP_G00090600 [Metynnis hypsauchen]